MRAERKLASERTTLAEPHHVYRPFVLSISYVRFIMPVSESDLTQKSLNAKPQVNLRDRVCWGPDSDILIYIKFCATSALIP
jgi:hypothetical protein